MSVFDDSMTLKEARDELRGLLHDGAHCPCCTLYVRLYKHKLDSAMARTLIVMYRRGAGSEYLHVPSLPGDNHKVSQCSWWDLVRELEVARDDGGKAGYWALTRQGVQFVRGEVSIPKYARIYDARVYGHVGEQVTIRDCLGDRFDYGELMSR